MQMNAVFKLHVCHMGCTTCFNNIKNMTKFSLDMFGQQSAFTS